MKNNSANEILNLADVSFRRDGNTFQIKNLNLSVFYETKIVLAGEAGAGKSTLLKIIAGLEQHSAGDVRFKKIIQRGPNFQLIAGNPGIAYLPQESALRHHYRMEELFEMANSLSKNNLEQIISLCGIGELLKRKSHELSGGEKQRLGLAKILVSTPSLLLLDEPFSNLDPPNKNQLRKVLENICGELKITCILSSHDPSDTLSWADRIFVMKAGKITEANDPLSIYLHPETQYSAALFGDYNIFVAEDLNKLHADVPAGRYLLRPEKIKIVENQSGALKAVIREIKFLGPQFLLRVSCNKIEMKILSQSIPGRVGDLLNISLNAGDLHAISRDE